MKIEFLKVKQDAKVPLYASKGAAAADLFASIDEDIVLKSGERKLIPTGIAISMPTDIVALVHARSGLGTKFGIGLSNGVGVIDSDYRGEIHVGLINFSNEEFVIHKHDRIGQIRFAPVLIADFIEVENLDETERGIGGFGSTGKN